MNYHINLQYIKTNHILQVIIIALCLLFPLFFATKLYLLPFAISAGFIIVILFIARPFIGLIIYSSFVFIRPQEFINILENLPFPLERTIALILIVSMVLKLKGKVLKSPLPIIDYGILAFAGVAFLSIFTSIWISQSWESWLKIFRLFVIYVLFVRLTDSRQQLKYLILFIIFSSAFHAFASLYNYFHGIFMKNIYMEVDRAIGIDQSFSAPNSLAATMAYTLPFIYYYYMGDRSKLARIFLLIITPVMLACIILTGSRAGMAGVIFFIMLVIWQNKHKLRNFIAAMLLLGAIWMLMPGQYKNRFESITDLSSGSASAESARGRLLGLEYGIEMAMDRPFLGYGIGNFPTALGLIYSPHHWYQAHSLPGQLLGEIGILGLIAFIFWIFVLFKSLVRLKKIFKAANDRFLYFTAAGLIVQLLCLLFFGLGEHNLNRYNWYIISAMAAIMMKKDFVPRTVPGAINDKSGDYPDEIPAPADN